ncbi:MAG: hypothetical protein NTV79_09550, partial [Candidatus Aureabacteria bacterium]|nr:hypothetical protein [Candidatus Auribacterota bacterium]
MGTGRGVGAGVGVIGFSVAEGVGRGSAVGEGRGTEVGDGVGGGVGVMRQETWRSSRARSFPTPNQENLTWIAAGS